jgi:threonylcarbamoyladenosine tRNA methylthiotransferase MtaB
MPAVNGTDIKSRAARLRMAGTIRVADHLRNQVGKTHHILMESPTMGRTEQFTPVLFDQPRPEGQIVQARILSAAADHLAA